MGTRPERQRFIAYGAVIPTQPLWMSIPLPEYPALDRDLDVDVLIVGAGLPG